MIDIVAVAFMGKGVAITYSTTDAPFLNRMIPCSSDVRSAKEIVFDPSTELFTIHKKDNFIVVRSSDYLMMVDKHPDPFVK